MRARVAIALAAAACAGCNGDTERLTADCASRFSWDGQRYAGRGPLERVPRVIGTLGRGAIRGCRGGPVQPAMVFELAAVPPAVAVLVRTDENPHEPRLWTIPGTLVESAGHPLHDALFDAGEPDPARHLRCGSSRTLTVRVTEPTRQDYGPRVAAADGVTGKEFLEHRGISGFLSVAADTRLIGADRGVPFVGRGDLLRIRARRCRDTAKYRARHNGTRTDRIVVDRLRVLERA